MNNSEENKKESQISRGLRVLEAISRLEGEEALEYAKENIRDYYGDYFANPYTV